MITWSSTIDIQQPPETVFQLLANLQEVPQSAGSPVLALDLITEGQPRLGSTYREVVRMLPGITGEMISIITAFDPPWVLEMDWRGPAMGGVDRYELREIQAGTTLSHQKTLSCPGVLRLIEPVLQIPLFPRLEARLVALKRLLEAQRHG